MRKIVSGVIVALFVVGVVFGQEVKNPPSAPIAAEVPKPETEAEKALKKQNAELQSQLAKATEEERKKQARKNFSILVGGAKKEIEDLCAENGAKWAFMQAQIGNQTTTFLGCIGEGPVKRPSVAVKP